ncbi:hypothetical protein DFH06DRAFT_1176006 [Mycena polygramma]|nr:hypothetical protein DFH06DRAFT_1176006 [Mycena polygramma]
MAPSSSLAQELIDVIVDEVPRNTLTACSLVAKSFLVPSQRRLFRAILSEFERARDLFAMSPHLGGYVRHLVLCLTPSQDYAAIEMILPVVTHLTGMSIMANAYSLNWRELPTRVRSLLKDRIVNPRFEYLSFTSIADVPSSVIMHATSSLLAISLYSTSVNHEIGSATPFIPAPDPMRPTTLQDVAIVAREERPWTSVLALDLHRHLRGLQVLRLGINEFEEDWGQLLLESDAHVTLKVLELYFDSLLPVLDLPLCPVLRTLDFKFLVPNQSLPAELDHLLATLATAAPLLESLSFSAETVAMRRSKWAGGLEPYPLFASVDFVKQLPHLRKLHWARNTGTAFDDSFEEYVEAKFPGPRDAKILDFSSFGR